MKISDYTMMDICYYEAMCNFTQEEQQLFELRAAGKSLEDCAEIMHKSVDAVKALSRKVNAKIERVN